MTDPLARLLEAARLKKWRVEEHATPPALPAAIARRFPLLPEELREFHSRVKTLANPENNAWFVTHDDLTRPREYEGFAWDAFENMSLDALKGDREAEDEVRRFWDGHFPIALSVGGDYAYAAIMIKSGEVVYGEEPAFDEASRIATSFPHFLEQMEKAIGSGAPDGILALFV